MEFTHLSGWQVYKQLQPEQLAPAVCIRGGSWGRILFSIRKLFF